MRLQFMTSVVLLGMPAFLLVSPQASAQYRSAPPAAATSRPTISPYTTLGGRGFTSNYFNVVRPEMEMRSLLGRQGATLQQLEQRLKEALGPDQKEMLLKQLLRQEGAGLPQTGHRTYFSNYSHYYGGTR